MNKESTLYDYTRSAKELRVFELGETCSRIIHEYEMFNLQNDVYKMFGEWLLNEAKTKYSAVFTEKMLMEFLKGKGLPKPDPVIIGASEDDYDRCEKLRELCESDYIHSLGGYRSNYSWYTIWKIAKTYNCRNGCIVVDAPSRLMSNSNWAIALDWSKKAQDCISHEAWKDDAEKDNGIGWYLVGGACAGVVLGFIAYVVLAIFGVDINLILMDMISAFVCSILFSACFRKLYIAYNLDRLSKNFNNHCKRIEETRYSRYSIRCDEQRDWAGNCLGWF